MRSDRGPAVVLDEIIKTTRVVVKGEASKLQKVIVNRGRDDYKTGDLMEQGDCAKKGSIQSWWLNC